MPTYGGGPNPPVRLDKWQNIIEVGWLNSKADLSILSFYTTMTPAPTINTGYFHEVVCRLSFPTASDRWGETVNGVPNYNGWVGPFSSITPTPLGVRAEGPDGFYTDSGGAAWRLPTLSYSGTDALGRPKSKSLLPYNEPDNFASISDNNDLGKYWLWHVGEGTGTEYGNYGSFIINNIRASRYWFGGGPENKSPSSRQDNFAVQLSDIIRFQPSPPDSINFRVRVANVSLSPAEGTSSFFFDTNKEVKVTNVRWISYCDIPFNYDVWWNFGNYLFKRNELEIDQAEQAWINDPDRVEPW